MSEVTRQLLNLLVDQGFTAQVPGSSAMSSLLRWGEEELITENYDDGSRGFSVKNRIFPRLKKDEWFLFEIGRNLGNIFSADIVESIDIKDRHCIIRFKK